MTVLPDPAELDRIASTIARHADSVRARATLLDHASDHTRWHGSAAVAFADSAREVGRALRHAGDGLDTAARTLTEHARAVEQALATVRSIAVHTGRTVDEVLHTAGDRLGELATDPTRLVGDLTSELGSAVSSAGGLLGL